MESKKYSTVITVPRYNRKLVETEGTPMLLTHIYMNPNFDGFL
jgi:hypothetical protein